MNLSPRQRQVAELVARGLSTKAIAHETGLAPRTVDEYIREAAQRLDMDGKPRHRLTMFILVLNAPEA